MNVTGYPRTEIVSKNCRFLQSDRTDQHAVQRLRASIERRQECVELLLNRKKSGEPFWNLLYVTPLYDEKGKLRFFLGGQINCSTVIDTPSAVLRVLAQSSDLGSKAGDVTETLRERGPRPSRSRAFLRSLSFGSASRVSAVQTFSAPGMEDGLLEQLNGTESLREQEMSLYTAYSNVGHHHTARTLV